MITNPAPPTIGVQRNPTPMTAGSGFTLNWSTTGATSLSHVCSAAGSGYTVNEGVPVSGSTGGTASASWVGYPSTCTWTASGPGGDTSFTEVMNTNPAPPTIQVQRDPATMMAGSGYTLTWSTTGATSLSHVCNTTGSGYTVNEGVPVNGSTGGTASASWVGYPSNCTWTAEGPGGRATYSETMSTNPAKPTISVQRNPSTMVAGSAYTLTWSTTDATSLSHVCNAAGGGYTVNEGLAVSGSTGGTASASWVGNPSTCTWLASGPSGTTTLNETMITNPARPTLNVVRSPNPMLAGNYFTLTLQMTGATSLSHVCTSSGSGYTVNTTIVPGPANATGQPLGYGFEDRNMASPDWVGYPSNCTWEATGPGGTATVTETMVTVAAEPRINVIRNPSPMMAGSAYTVNWGTTDATYVTHECTAAGSGYTVKETLAASGSANGTAIASWVGFPSSCTWTAYGPGGSKTFSETMTTNPAPQPTIQVQRSPNPMTASSDYTLTWSTTDATSVSHVCTASGTGYTVNEPLALNGSAPGTTNPNWVGYPSNCTWTATGPGGTATFNETMTTNASGVEEVTYIHTDALGSPIARTDASGKFIVSRTGYEPYGLTASGVTPTIGFTGHVNDADTGLVYMQQRYYDPVAARFLSIDPVTTNVDTGLSFSRYAYANNSPYKYLDKDGRNPALVLGAEGAEIGTMILPGWGTAIGGVVGAGLGWYLGDKAAQWIASASGGAESGNKPQPTMGAQSASGGALPPDDNNKGGGGEKSRNKPPEPPRI